MHSEFSDVFVSKMIAMLIILLFVIFFSYLPSYSSKISRTVSIVFFLHAKRYNHIKTVVNGKSFFVNQLSIRINWFSDTNIFQLKLSRQISVNHHFSYVEIASVVKYNQINYLSFVLHILKTSCICNFVVDFIYLFLPQSHSQL